MPHHRNLFSNYYQSIILFKLLNSVLYFHYLYFHHLSSQKFERLNSFTRFYAK
jgi:hypothetical protein